MSIRNAAITDFNFIRKLAVQLACPPVTALTSREFQALSQDVNVRLLVLEAARKPAVFMAINFMPAFNSRGNFLVITWFAIDRFSMNLAAELEEHVTGIGEEQGAYAILVQTGDNAKARGFFERQGYKGQKKQLIKILTYSKKAP